MPPAAFLTITDQAAEHLRSEILRGRWSGVLPGKHQLAAELGLNNKTVEAAMRQLEKAGLLIPQGAGRRRLINPRGGKSSSALRIAIFLNEGMHELRTELFIQLSHDLASAGHTVIHAPDSLTELRFDLKRIAAVVEETGADAWIISAGSREVLEWFAVRSLPCFALFGHRGGIRMPGVGPDKQPAMREATRRLVELGHRRIVLLCRKIRRLPKPGLSETAFLDTLRESGCATGDYNLPDWEETNAGFQECLHALFLTTPPTALIVQEATYFVAAMQFLLSRGLRVPGNVSLICTDDDPVFLHCEPPVSSITWDRKAVVRRIIAWAANISRGKPDNTQSLTPATFVPGGTIGPRPGSRDADA